MEMDKIYSFKLLIEKTGETGKNNKEKALKA
jgi:hypothetical protein